MVVAAMDTLLRKVLFFCFTTDPVVWECQANETRRKSLTPHIQGVEEHAESPGG